MIEGSAFENRTPIRTDLIICGISKMLGTKRDEYEIYRKHADNGKGIDITTGKPMKTFEQWLSS
jgi:hypothetical protein